MPPRPTFKSTAILTLESLLCQKESDRGPSHSEPYVWPAMVIVANNPLSNEITPQIASLSNSRSVIKNEMRAGETATLPSQLNTLTANFQASQTSRNLILIVGLWEADDTPLSAVQAGYKAFLDELHAALDLGTLLRLSSASPAEQEEIIDEIKKRVGEKVFLAIFDKLSWWEKATLDRDDLVGVDFKTFEISDRPGPGGLSLPLSFTMSIRDEKQTAIYQIQGKLKVQFGDRCKAEIDAVNAARSTLQTLEANLTEDRELLKIATDPQLRESLQAEIDRLNSEIPPAKEALENARRAVELCEETHVPILL